MSELNDTAEIGNGTDADAAVNVEALSIATVLGLRAAIQAALIGVTVLGVASIAFLRHKRQLRARIYGPLATGVSQLMMFVVDGALIAVAVMQFVAVTAHGLPCPLHSALSTSLVPICGTVLLLRAWVLVVQFARVHEQLRWMKLYQMSPKDRDLLERLPMPFSARVDLWLSSHPVVVSPALLMAFAVAFSVAVWAPSIAIDIGNGCDHDLPNDWNDLNVWLFLGLALVLGLKLRGKLDTIGIRHELTGAAAILVVVQALQMLVDVFERQTRFDPDLDGDALEDEYGVEVAFAFWYGHGLAALQLLLLVVLVAVRPMIALLGRRIHFTKETSAQQKLHQILNDRHLKDDFQDFLQREFSIENLAFHDSVKTLTKKSLSVFGSPNDESLRLLEKRIDEIVDDFVAPTGRFQVNLPSDDRRVIERCVTDLRADGATPSDGRIRQLKATLAALSQAQATIFVLMANDSLPRFLRERHEETLTTVKSGPTTGNVASQVPVTVRAMDSASLGF